MIVQAEAGLCLEPGLLNFQASALALKGDELGLSEMLHVKLLCELWFLTPLSLIIEIISPFLLPGAGKKKGPDPPPLFTSFSW